MNFSRRIMEPRVAETLEFPNSQSSQAPDTPQTVMGRDFEVGDVWKPEKLPRKRNLQKELEYPPWGKKIVFICGGPSPSLQYKVLLPPKPKVVKKKKEQKKKNKKGWE